MAASAPSGRQNGAVPPSPNASTPTPTGAFPGHAVLQAPVRALEDWVRARTAHYDTAYLSADPLFVHAHVTALGPLPQVVDARVPEHLAATVARVCAQVAPFVAVLQRLDTFPNGVIHLLPDDDSGFRSLTAHLRAELPEVLPYGGEFVPVPHLTLDAVQSSDVGRDAGGQQVTEASTARAVRHLLPAHEHVQHLDLAWYEPGRCRLLRRWELGTGRVVTDAHLQVVQP